MVVSHHAANIVYLNSVFTASNISVIQIMSTPAAVALLREEGCNKGFQFICTGLAKQKTSSGAFKFIMNMIKECIYKNAYLKYENKIGNTVVSIEPYLGGGLYY